MIAQSTTGNLVKYVPRRWFAILMALEVEQALLKGVTFLGYRLSISPTCLTDTAHRKRSNFFAKPKARSAYQEAFEQLAQETGWTVHLSPKANHKALTERVRQVIPLLWEVFKVSIFPHQSRVAARIQTLVANPSEDDLAAAQATYLDQTGRTLELEQVPPPSAPEVLFTASGRMEINAASRLIKSGFAERAVALLRCSQKLDPEPLLELGFISPTVGERHLDLVEQLQAKTGWTLRIRGEANQVALAQRARQLLPPEWAMKGQASFMPGERVLRFKALVSPQPQLVQKACQQLEKETGFRVLVEFTKPR